MSIAPLSETSPDEDVIAAVAVEHHPNAVKLARSDMLSALPFLLLGAAALLGGVLFRELRMIAIPGFIAASWGLGRIVQYLRVVREDPVKRWRRELKENHDLTEYKHDFELRKAAVTPILTIGLIGLISIVSLVEFASTGVRGAVPIAALVKPAVRNGEWWRLLTAAYLHASVGHLVGNMMGLWVLGRVVEIYDSKWRIPLVFLVSALGCSIASTALVTASSLGASGGVAGLLGYLLVSAWTKSNGTPEVMRKGMAQMVASMVLTGIAGYRYVDNAGHAGGLVAGILVAYTIGKASARPEHEPMLDHAGWISMVILIAGAAFAVARLVIR